MSMTNWGTGPAGWAVWADLCVHVALIGPDEAENWVVELPNRQYSWLQKKSLESFVFLFFWRAWDLGGSHRTCSTYAEAQGQTLLLCQQGSLPQRVCWEESTAFAGFKQNQIAFRTLDLTRGVSLCVQHKQKTELSQSSPALVSHSLAVTTRDSSWLVWEWEGMQSLNKKSFLLGSLTLRRQQLYFFTGHTFLLYGVLNWPILVVEKMKLRQEKCSYSFSRLLYFVDFLNYFFWLKHLYQKD